MKNNILIDISIADIGCIPCVSPDKNGNIIIKNDSHSFTMTKEDIINKGICFYFEDEGGFTVYEEYKLVKRDK